jgi:hypothetical protein
MKATLMANQRRMISKIFNIFLRFCFRCFSNRLLKDFHQIIYHNRKKYHCATRIKDYFRYMFLIHNKKSPRFYNAKCREKFSFYFLDDSYLQQLNNWPKKISRLTEVILLFFIVFKTLFFPFFPR